MRFAKTYTTREFPGIEEKATEVTLRSEVLTIRTIRDEKQSEGKHRRVREHHCEQYEGRIALTDRGRGQRGRRIVPEKGPCNDATEDCARGGGREACPDQLKIS